MQERVSRPPVIAGVNGIWSDGSESTDKLLADLRKNGYPVRDVNLKVVGPLRARWAGKADGEYIAREVPEGSILVLHSFGNIRGHYAHLITEYAYIICIAPAHSHTAEWRNPERVWCYYSPSDYTVRIGSWLRFSHPFGAAGIRGYSQPGVHNVRMHSDHDDYFQDAALRNEIRAQIELLWDYRYGKPSV